MATQETFFNDFLSKIIKSIAVAESEVEDARVSLAQNVSFEPFIFFRKIDISGNGYLSDKDLNEFIRQHGLILTDGELQQIFQGQQISPKISYNDFLNLTLPSSNIELRNKCLDRSGPLTIRNMHDDTISSVEKLITAVFRKEVDFYRKIEVNITSETNLQSLNLDQCFEKISSPDTGLITFKHMDQFMKENHYNISKENFEAVMRRIDKQKKGRVTITEFCGSIFAYISQKVSAQPQQGSYYRTSEQIQSQHEAGRDSLNNSGMKNSGLLTFNNPFASDSKQKNAINNRPASAMVSANKNQYQINQSPYSKSANKQQTPAQSASKNTYEIRVQAPPEEERTLKSASGTKLQYGSAQKSPVYLNQQSASQYSAHSKKSGLVIEDDVINQNSNSKMMKYSNSKQQPHSPQELVQEMVEEATQRVGAPERAQTEGAQAVNHVNTTRHNFYSEQVAAIKNNPIYQLNAPQTFATESNALATVGGQDIDTSQGNIATSAANNTLDNRFADPNYGNLWNYSKDHDQTIGPSNLSTNFQSKFPEDYKRTSTEYDTKGSKYVPYFHPQFVEKPHKPDNYRYPENPFKHTNHEHYFKNYYTNLKGDFLDRHYTKTSPYKSQYTHTKQELPSTSTYNRFSKHGLFNSNEPLRFQPTKYSQMSTSNYRGISPSNYRSSGNNYASHQPTSSHDYYPAKYNLKPDGVDRYLKDYVPGSYTSLYQNKKSPVGVTGSLLQGNTTTETINQASHVYQPYSRKELEQFDKPKTSLKIEEDKPVARQLDYQPGQKQVSDNELPVVTDTANISGNQQGSENTSSQPKGYKFANGKYENLWGNVE